MDTNDKHENGHHHDAWSEMSGRGHWKHVVIKILVALFIFWAGVQFGELKAMVRAQYFGAPGDQGYGNYGMMGNWRY